MADRAGAGALPHGYTNETALAGEGAVEKRYRWADAAARRRREVRALRRLAPYLPVPAVLDERPDSNAVRLALLPGRHGQELIDEGQAPAVLRLLGDLLRRLQSLNPSLLTPDAPAGQEGLPGQTERSQQPEQPQQPQQPQQPGAVIVHGDFGPQNALLDLEAGMVTGLLDWEWVHLGAPVEDLAWAEWLVRTHHARHLPALGALFAGYGSRPPWPERHRAMVAACRFHLDRLRRLGDAAGADLWRRRMEQTAAWGPAEFD